MKRYNPKEIEPKWQSAWEEQGIYRASNEINKPKRYVLEYFPYPSGAAMHVGHVRNYTIGDVVARYHRMTGHNVLHPMGWDAFGLPAENYAIKNKVSPQVAIAKNTTKFKKQLMQMGFSYDWSREINSSDPSYYKWTQWFFLLLYKRGLAYQKESLQWWCPTDKTVLANEQVENGKCWRCGSDVAKKSLKQWFFKITDYAERLEKDLENLNWSNSIKTMQKNWIGRSKGAEIDFKVVESDQLVKVFTTRPDTIFGATFMVLAPEHPLIKNITSDDQKSAVQDYIKQSLAKSDIERQETEPEKTGVFTGAYAINPVNNAKIPIWTSDYVLMGYGTGAIMSVPAHDERDYEFAKKFNLPIVYVFEQAGQDQKDFYSGEGKTQNSDKYNGLLTSETREKITTDLVKKGVATEKINFKMRDWLISRQRYWGAPIPIIHCKKCGIQPVPEKDLPVILPDVKSYEPSGDGHSPLANVSEFVNVACPKCHGAAQRETDTMDGFACSSWYFLRFIDPKNSVAAFGKDKIKHWLPVDDYIGGAEHAVMHLLYARFWTKVMFDEGLIDFEEPFTTLRNQGMILAPDGQKMSKSKGNTIEPDSLISQGYGADSVRIMELFIGPWNQSASWSVEGIAGAFRFLQRVWTICQEHIEAKTNMHEDGPGASESPDLMPIVHKAIKRVTQDMHELGFNTAIASLMELVNDLYKLKVEKPLGSKDWHWALATLLQLLAPFAPHITEELWQQLGETGSIHTSNWPQWDDKYLLADQLIIVVQVNGKVRANIEVSTSATESEIKKAAIENEKIQSFLNGKEPKKTIYVPSKLVNFVI